MIIAFIIGLIIIFNILFIYCLMTISKEASEREVKYVKSNKRRYKQIQIHKKR